MEANRKKQIIIYSVLLIFGAALTAWMLYAFNNVPEFKSLFSVSDAPVIGSVGPESEATLAQKADFTARVSMWIFIFITLLQLAALGVGYAVVSSIASSNDPVKLKLRSLDNAEVFFDVPLYFGLFGTVSAFLVMTFSPQSSRLIAYSSTLIGIIFSLLLRLILQYPLRKKLVRQDALENEGAAK
jgi:hypothetical protein